MIALSKEELVKEAEILRDFNDPKKRHKQGLLLIY
jgi:hypothetical protein